MADGNLNAFFAYFAYRLSGESRAATHRPIQHLSFLKLMKANSYM